MKSNFYKNKTKQLRSLVKQLMKSLAKNGNVDSQTNILVLKIRELISQLSRNIKTRQLKRIIGSTAMVLGITFSSNLSAQNFAAPVLDPFGLDTFIIANPALTDLDNDGDLDLLTGEYGGALVYYENVGNASQASFPEGVSNPFGLESADGYAFPTFADLDNDGDMDVLVGDYYGNTLYFENMGTASEPAFPNPITNAFGLVPLIDDVVTPEFGDLDGDGDLDLIIGEYYGAFQYFENIGSAESPEFGNKEANPFGLDSIDYVALPALADLDADGDLDLFSGSLYGNLAYFENTGGPMNPAFAPEDSNPFGFIATTYLSTPEFGDMDGDGDLDLLSGGVYGSYSYYENLEINVSTQDEAEVEFRIFPNPASTELFIQSEENISIVELLDQNGRVLQTRTGDNSVDISSLRNGMYLLRISNEDGRTSSRKFIVE